MAGKSACVHHFGPLCNLWGMKKWFLHPYSACPPTGIACWESCSWLCCGTASHSGQGFQIQKGPPHVQWALKWAWNFADVSSLPGETFLEFQFIQTLFTDTSWALQTTEKCEPWPFLFYSLSHVQLRHELTGGHVLYSAFKEDFHLSLV